MIGLSLGAVEMSDQALSLRGMEVALAQPQRSLNTDSEARQANAMPAWMRGLDLDNASPLKRPHGAVETDRGSACYHVGPFARPRHITVAHGPIDAIGASVDDMTHRGREARGKSIDLSDRLHSPGAH